MNYNVSVDVQAVMTLLHLSASRLAEELHVSRSTISRILNGEVVASELFLETFYSFAYSNRIRGLRLNQLNVQLKRDMFDCLLFHGAKGPIEGEIDLSHSRGDVDMGPGFYLGEGYEQAASYIQGYVKSSVYLFDGRALDRLVVQEYDVSLEWMLLVAHYRRRLKEYDATDRVREIVSRAERADVIVAPIADNDMYETMDRFARGELTDLQAVRALSASDLGKQHVLRTQKACSAIQMVGRLYLCAQEREDIRQTRIQRMTLARDKAKLAITASRRQGNYVEEILK